MSAIASTAQPTVWEICRAIAAQAEKKLPLRAAPERLAALFGAAHIGMEAALKIPPCPVPEFAELDHMRRVAEWAKQSRSVWLALAASAGLLAEALIEVEAVAVSVERERASGGLQ